MTKKLESLIEKFGRVKKEFKDIKKESENLTLLIKETMISEGLDSVDTENYKVILQTRTSESLDEDRVIEILKANKIKGIVKTKQYIDEDALEEAIYKGRLDADIIKQINNTKIVSTTNALILKENK